METMRDCHDSYLKNKCFLIAGVFENVRDICMKIIDLIQVVVTQLLDWLKQMYSLANLFKRSMLYGA